MKSLKKVIMLITTLAIISCSTENNDGSFLVEMTLPIYGKQSIAQALDLGNFIKKELVQKEMSAYLRTFKLASTKLDELPDPERNIDVKPVTNFSLPITGIVIDARYLGLEPALSPFIINKNGIIYPSKSLNLESEKIIEKGILEYQEQLHSSFENDSRVGTNPLIIKASEAVGKNHKTDVLLDNQGFRNFINAHFRYKILNELNVIIVR